MATVIMNIYKGQRMDLTAQMKDADAILSAFHDHAIKFEKKYTTLGGKGPSTITFKGLKAENVHGDLTDMIFELYQAAREEKIGNVYVKLTSFIKPRIDKMLNKVPEERIDIPDEAYVPNVFADATALQGGDMDGDEVL